MMPSVALRGHQAAAGNFRTSRRLCAPTSRSRTYRRCTQTATSDIYSAESAISRALMQLGGPDRQARPEGDEPGSAYASTLVQQSRLLLALYKA